MRYIKAYKLFESDSYNDINYDIEDICAELKDEGYDIEIINDKKNKEINLYIGNNEELIIKNSLIMETINRLIKYMSDLKYTYKIETQLMDSHEYESLDSIIDIFNKKTLEICLIFKH